MNRTSIACFVALSLAAAAGCKKGGGECDKAIAHSLEVSKATMPSDEKVLTKLRDLGAQHCKDDKWGGEAIQCMIDAKTETDAQACYAKLSSEQQGKLNKAAMEMMTPPSGGSAAAPPAAGAGSAAGAGGATGSDAAGSAGSAAAGSDTGGAAAAGSAAGSADGSAGSAAAPK
jgi:hypothetical protein